MNTILYRTIRLEGWLRRQLEIQAAGLSGNLDKMWPDVRDSAWIGGDREGWERVPYWLDGFIPLAQAPSPATNACQVLPTPRARSCVRWWS